MNSLLSNYLTHSTTNCLSWESITRFDMEAPISFTLPTYSGLQNEATQGCTSHCRSTVVYKMRQRRVVPKVAKCTNVRWISNGKAHDDLLQNICVAPPSAATQQNLSANLCALMRAHAAAFAATQRVLQMFGAPSSPRPPSF